MTVFYHITHERNVPSIKSFGLIPPRIGKRSWHTITLTKKRYLKEWLNAALGDAFITGQTGNLRVIRVEIPESLTEREEADVAPQWHVLKGGSALEIGIDSLRILPKRYPISSARDVPFSKPPRRDRRRKPLFGSVAPSKEQLTT